MDQNQERKQEVEQQQKKTIPRARKIELSYDKRNCYRERRFDNLICECMSLFVWLRGRADANVYILLCVLFRLSVLFIIPIVFDC